MRIHQNQNGNVAVIVLLSVLVLIALVGLAGLGFGYFSTTSRAADCANCETYRPVGIQRSSGRETRSRVVKPQATKSVTPAPQTQSQPGQTQASSAGQQQQQTMTAPAPQVIVVPVTVPTAPAAPAVDNNVMRVRDEEYITSRTDEQRRRRERVRYEDDDEREYEIKTSKKRVLARAAVQGGKAFAKGRWIDCYSWKKAGLAGLIEGGGQAGTDLINPYKIRRR